MPGERATAVADDVLAAALLALDPAGLCGVVLKGPCGPERDAWVARFSSLSAGVLPVRRLPLHAAPARLLGGLDLGATLAAGRPVFERGILAATDGGTLLVGSAERLDQRAAAIIACALDCRETTVERDGLTERHPASFAVVACDESIGDEDGIHPALSDRLAMICHLNLATADSAAPWTAEDLRQARFRLASVQIQDDCLAALDQAAAQFGVRSLRVLASAARVARASAALAGRQQLGEDDLAAAARLVLGPRATVMPVEDAPPAEQRSQSDQPQPDTSETTGLAAQDIIVEAAKSRLPPELLDSGGGAAIQRSRTSGRAGAPIKGARRGRPAGVRASRSERGARLNLFETLRAAAPWQRLRHSPSSTSSHLIQVRPDDFRVTRLKHKAETATIFAVDASGSTAIARMAEAKGAIEMLLGHCYARRDQVALIAFGGRGTDLLLPPTRSLARVRRDLTELPGGGGTPLASGISAAARLAAQVRRRGQSPLIILLTDGRANLAFDGTPDRTRAMEDALAAAAAVKAGDLPGILIDTSSRRASEAAQRVAEAMGARYLPLPFGDAETLSHAVRHHARRGSP